ncbi:MAG TPA: hypothetical protein ENF94_01315 [Candidatus Woesearchaeota archaeon]|nr:hypothetical protein [Candidatus Woesearchaeota archaeon]
MRDEDKFKMRKISRTQQALIDYATLTRSLEVNERLKLILFVTGAKPVTYIMLKVFPEEPDEAITFERLLKEAGFIFNKSEPKTFEEISVVKGKEVRWDIKGVWIGYDLFHTKEQRQLFRKYISLSDKGKHVLADRLAGKLYDYPKDCVENFIRFNKNPDLIAKKFSYYEYYKFVHDCDRKFPFTQHQPHSLKCRSTIAMNKRYREAVKRFAPDFYRNFTRKRTYKADIVADVINDVMHEDSLTKENRSIWPVKDGQDIIFITLKPVESKFWLISHLVKKCVDRGTVFPARITMQYDFAVIELGKPKSQVGELFHERKFPLQAEK